MGKDFIIFRTGGVCDTGSETDRVVNATAESCLSLF